MRIRDLERWLLDHGWIPEPEKGGATVAWTHPATKRRLCYHKPHGTDAAEVPKSMARQVLRRLERMEGQAR